MSYVFSLKRTFFDMLDEKRRKLMLITLKQLSVDLGLRAKKVEKTAGRHYLGSDGRERREGRTGDA